MLLSELKEKVGVVITNAKDGKGFINENSLYDYKKELNFYGKDSNTTEECIDIFIDNFFKDILSFSNTNGGVILIGIKQEGNEIIENGLDGKNEKFMTKLDTAKISDKFFSLCKTSINLEIDAFNIGSKKCFYILIEKSNQVIFPVSIPDKNKYKLKNGDIVYRESSKNTVANASPSDFNKFLQTKSNEKSKEFMEIWSKLLPEMFDINPKEILIINPNSNKAYGLDTTNNMLSSVDIQIDNTKNSGINLILNAISAGEIGKISSTEGKPIYKIVGEITKLIPAKRNYLALTTLEREIKKINNGVKFNFTNEQLKKVIIHLNWVLGVSNVKDFKIDNPKNPGIINENFESLIWIENLGGQTKIVFSTEAIKPIIDCLNNESLHQAIFNRALKLIPPQLQPNTLSMLT